MSLKIFGLGSSQPFAESIAEQLGVKLTPHREEYFDDKEPYIQSSPDSFGNVRGADVFVVLSLASDEVESINDKFFKLAMFIGSLKDASASRVTAVLPYLGYGRQDRKTVSRAPITTKYRARMLESVGTDRILTLDVHNLAAEQNALRIPLDNLEARNIFADYFAENLPRDKRIVILSPDQGGWIRSSLFCNRLAKKLKMEVGMAQLDKIRGANRKARASTIIGDVKDCLVIPYDDMISSGGTLVTSVNVVQRFGGEVWGICATHGLFVGDANENMASEHIKRICVTDTINPFRLHESNRKKVTIVNTTSLFAEAINRIHSDSGSISDLLK